MVSCCNLLYGTNSGATRRVIRKVMEDHGIDPLVFKKKQKDLVDAKDIVKVCPVCSKEFNARIGKKESETCSHSCANKIYRRGRRSGLWKDSVYRTTCFLYHKKECVVCGEKLVVAVHHADGDKKNNDPRNLIPLCPTHHQYMHSKHRHVIEGVVKEYVESFSAQYCTEDVLPL